MGSSVTQFMAAYDKRGLTTTREHTPAETGKVGSAMILEVETPMTHARATHSRNLLRMLGIWARWCAPTTPPAPSHLRPSVHSAHHPGHSCGEQRGRAVALVVVGHRASACSSSAVRAGCGRAPEFGSFRRRQHDRMRRRVDVEAGRVLQLDGKLRIVGELELADPVRRPRLRQYALHRGDADPGRLGHRRRRPVVASAGSPAVSSTTRAITVLSKAACATAASCRAAGRTRRPA